MSIIYYTAQPSIDVRTLVGTISICARDSESSSQSLDAVFTVQTKFDSLSEGNIPTLEGIAGVYDWSSADASLFYYVDLKGEVAPSNHGPSHEHTFDWDVFEWRDKRTLSDMKIERSEIINQARAKANQSSFTYNGKQIAADRLSRSDIDAVLGAVTLNNEMPAGWLGGWKAMDNTYVSIPDVATWKVFYTAMVSQGTANFNHSQRLKARLEAATTNAEVEAIVW